MKTKNNIKIVNYANVEKICGAAPDIEETKD